MSESRAGVLGSLLTTLLLSIVAPLVTFNVLKSNGFSDFSAYLWASVGPLVETIGVAIIKRQADKISMMMLGLNLVAAVVTVLGDTGTTMLLLKDSAMTAAFGVICMVTLSPLVPRPLMYYFAQKFGGRSEEGMARFEQMWVAYPGFRHTFRTMTAVWGGAYLIEAAVKVVLAETVSFNVAYNANQVLPLVVFGGLMVWTFWYSKRAQRRGEARRAAEQAETQLQTEAQA